jgi:hypothetical protein
LPVGLNNDAHRNSPKRDRIQKRNRIRKPNSPETAPNNGL